MSVEPRAAVIGAGIYRGVLEVLQPVIAGVQAADAGKPISAERDYRLTLLYFFCKSLKTYQAIYALWEHGFEQDALVLHRTLFETLIQAEWVRVDPARRAVQFQDHAETRPYASFLDMKDQLAASRLHDAADMLNKIQADPHFPHWERRYRDYQAKYLPLPAPGGQAKKVPREWWGDSVAELVKMLIDQGVDAKFLSEEYHYGYAAESGLVHTRAPWRHDYVELTKDGLHLRYGPEKPENVSVVVHAARRLLRVAAVLNDAFGLAHQVPLREAIADLDHSVGGVGGAGPVAP